MYLDWEADFCHTSSPETNFHSCIPSGNHFSIMCSVWEQHFRDVFSLQNNFLLCIVPGNKAFNEIFSLGATFKLCTLYENQFSVMLSVREPSFCHAFILATDFPLWIMSRSQLSLKHHYVISIIDSVCFSVMHSVWAPIFRYLFCLRACLSYVLRLGTCFQLCI